MNHGMLNELNGMLVYYFFNSLIVRGTVHYYSLIAFRNKKYIQRTCVKNDACEF